MGHIGAVTHAVPIKAVTLCGWARLTGGLNWAVVTLQPRTSPDDDSRSPCNTTTTFPIITQRCRLVFVRVLVEF